MEAPPPPPAWSGPVSAPALVWAAEVAPHASNSVGIGGAVLDRSSNDPQRLLLLLLLVALASSAADIFNADAEVHVDAEAGVGAGVEEDEEQ